MTTEPTDRCPEITDRDRETARECLGSVRMDYLDSDLEDAAQIIAQACEKVRREKMDEWVEKAREITDKALEQAAKACERIAEKCFEMTENSEGATAQMCATRIRALMEGE